MFIPPELGAKLRRELKCLHIYGIGSRLERSLRRRKHTIQIVVADDVLGTNARLAECVYSRHKGEWREVSFPKQRQPNKAITGRLLGVATF